MVSPTSRFGMRHIHSHERAEVACDSGSCGRDIEKAECRSEQMA